MIVIFVLALVVRLGVVIATPGYVPRHDDRDYDRIAWSMAQGHGYPPTHAGRNAHVWSDAYRPPLFPAVAAALVPFVLVIAPWTIRNAVELHAFVPVSTESGTTLLGTYNLQSMTDRAAPGSWQLLRHDNEARLAHEDLPPAVRDVHLRDAALRFVARHPAYPVAVVWHNLRRWLDLAGIARARYEARTVEIRGEWVDAMLPFAWTLAALAALGLAMGTARGTPRAFWLAPALLLATTLLVNAETPRFRAPIDPFLILLAVAAVSRHRPAIAASARGAGRRRSEWSPADPRR